MFRGLLCALICAGLLAGCASAPRRASIPEPALGAAIAAQAFAQLGRPYRYGGEGPDAFDCSGLVHYAYGAVGVDTPRTTTGQYRAARHIDAARLAPGDLLFFRIDSRNVSHVGIYVGDGQFVHAPQTGRPVEQRQLDDPYYQPRFVAAGRLY